MTAQDHPPRRALAPEGLAGADPPLRTWLEGELRGHLRPRERLLHLLHRLRERRGEITGEAVDVLAARMGLSPIQVYGVVTFHPSLTPGRPLPLEEGRVGSPMGPGAEAEHAPLDSTDVLGEILARSPDDIVEIVARWASGSEWPDLVRISGLWRTVSSTCASEKVVIATAGGSEALRGTCRESGAIDAELLVAGMVVAAHAVGADRGLVCLPQAARDEAVEIREAAARMTGTAHLSRASEHGSVAEIEVLRGFDGPPLRNASACIAALEGRRGTPRALAPDPAEQGLWGAPTLIAGVGSFVAVAHFLLRGETEVRVPVLIDGPVRRPGRALVAPRASVREVVWDVAGGPAEGRSVKAVLVGGATGVVIPAANMDVPLFGDRGGVGSDRQGAVGITVVAEDDCIVDLVGECLAAAVAESCGSCLLCRMGLPVLQETLERVAAGDGSDADLRLIENLGEQVARAAMCGFGRRAPTPLLSGLRSFGREFHAHLEPGGCTECHGPQNRKDGT